MAPVFKPRPRLDDPTVQKPMGLTQETVDEIKTKILGIKPVGFKSPPVHSRFRKGESGNPKGRPKKSLPPPPPLETPGLPVEQAILAETERLVQIRENGETKEMRAFEVVQRAHFKAAVDGSPYAQRFYMANHYRAKHAEDEAIREDHAYWRDQVSRRRQEIAETERNGTEPPAQLPYPDDVVFEPGKPVYFIGPANEEEQWRFEKQLALHGLLLMQAGYERRLFFDPDANEIINTPYVMAIGLNARFPKRHQLDTYKVEDIVHRYFCTSKRALLPRLRRAWREFGIPRHRGWVLPPLTRGRALAELLVLLSRYDLDCTRERYMDGLRRIFPEDASRKR